HTAAVDRNDRTTTGDPLSAPPLVAGTYTWSAHYSGDANNISANDQGGTAEQTIVSPANPNLVTAASGAITLGTTAPTLTDSAVQIGRASCRGRMAFAVMVGIGYNV